MLVRASYSQFDQFSNNCRTGLVSFNERFKCCTFFISVVRQASQATTRYSCNVKNFPTAVRQASKLPAVSSELWYCKVSRSVSVQTVTPAHTLLGYFAISGESVFHKTHCGHKRSSDRERYPSSIQTYITISCCGSSKEQPFPERTTFAASVSSTSMFERRKLFLNPDARQQHKSREQNGQVCTAVQQLSSDF